MQGKNMSLSALRRQINDLQKVYDKLSRHRHDAKIDALNKKYKGKYLLKEYPDGDIKLMHIRSVDNIECANILVTSDTVKIYSGNGNAGFVATANSFDTIYGPELKNKYTIIRKSRVDSILEEQRWLLNDRYSIRVGQVMDINFDQRDGQKVDKDK